jgi:hypothetical protein
LADTVVIPGGYILLARKIIESEIWKKPPLYLKVWVYLLARAQHSKYKNLEKGQLITSIPEIQENCSWYVGCRKEKPTRDQIFQIIDFLRKRCEHDCAHDTKATMITTTKATHKMLVTIQKYCVYQDSKLYESNAESNDEKDTKATRKQRQPDNINKNDKNVNNDKNDIITTYTTNQLLVEAIGIFIDMRNKIKKPVTDKAITILLNKLDSLTTNDSEKIEILNQSTVNCWQGIFPLKEHNPKPWEKKQNKDGRSLAERSLDDDYEEGLTIDI